MKIAKISILRPTVVVVISIITTFFGISSYLNLNQELFPRVAMQTILIATQYPGATPSEVETSVTKKIEDAVSSLEGIKDIKSVSMANFSLTTIRLKYGVDIDRIMQNAQRKISSIRSELPEGIKETSIEKYDFAELPILNLSVTSNITDEDFYDFINNKIKPSIESVSGVAQVDILGGKEREIQINIDSDKLEQYKLSITQVTQILTYSNLDFPIGKVEDKERQVLVRLNSKYSTISDIENIVLKETPDGGILRVRDIADVIDGQKEITSINRADGINSISIIIRRQADANAVEISKELEKKVAIWEQEYSDINLKFNVAFNDSEFTIEAINSVFGDLFMAIIFVAVTMLVFLHSFRNSLIVIIAIPISLVATFIVMYLMGLTINLATLLALSLVIGILVDDAIVVVENIHRHLELGKNRVQAAYDGIKELGLTVLSTTFVLVVVFIPITFTQNIVADLFKGFCYTAATAVLFSTIVSFSIVPLIASRISKIENFQKWPFIDNLVGNFENIISKISLQMRHLLAWSFNHKIIVFFCVFIMFIASIMLIPLGFIGSEFASIGDRGEFYLNIELPKTSTIEQTDKLTLQVEEKLRRNPYVKSVFTTVGAQEDGQSQPYLSELLIKTLPYDERDKSTEECSRDIKEMLQKEIVGAKFTTSQSAITGGKDVNPIEIYVTGNNIDSIMQVAKLIEKRISLIPGIVDSKLSYDISNTEISIIPNKEKMARLGISTDVVGISLYNAFSGNQDSKYQEGGYEYDINIRLDENSRGNIENIANFSLINAYGELVYLKQFADIKEQYSPSKFERRNRMPSIRVIAQISGRPVGDIGTDIIQIVDKMKLPSSISIVYGGEMENQNEGFNSIIWAFLISIVLIYLTMVLLYNSYIYPFAVLFSLPLAIIGALLAMALSMENLSIFTLLGLVMLIGLVAKNAIIVVDFANQLHNQGMEVKEALLEATQKRFRPVIMTVLSTVIGMLPIALAQGAGADWKNGLAWVLIGGLTTSSILTLIVVPLIYYILTKGLDKLGIKTKVIKLKS